MLEMAWTCFRGSMPLANELPREPMTLRYRRYFLLTPIVAILVTGLWFTAVCAEWRIETCQNCRKRSESMVTTAFGIEVRRNSVFTNLETPLESGQPHCSHDDMALWIKQRWWGLAFCFCPCHNGIHALV